VNLPSELSESIAAGWAGEAGDDWLDRLPQRIADAEQRWSLTIGDPYEPGGFTSFVAPAVTSVGDDVTYKITIPHDEALGEAEALRAYRGEGAVRLLDAKPDSFELLLERCSPGHSLWSVASDAERLETACSLMTRLWRRLAVDAVVDLGVVAGRWADVTTRRLRSFEHPWSPQPIERGIDLLRTLPGQSVEHVLLHGDFHPGNILSSAREPWLAIDPKPMIGDPAFEPVQLLTQRDGQLGEPPAPAEVERRLVGIAARVGLDPTRIGLWAIARTTEWSLWSWDRGDTVDAAIAHAWTQTLDVIVRES